MSKIIAVIGAGGKTTLVHRLAEKYRAEGRRVLLTTTTHMLVEEDTDVSCDAEELAAKLQQKGYCMAGRLCGEDRSKICGLPEEIFRMAAAAADVILVEADGAKHHSLKFPSHREPVLPENTDEVILVEGLWELGRPVSEVVFRSDLLPEDGSAAQDRRADWQLLRNCLEPEYRRHLAAAGFSGEMQILYTLKKEDGLHFLTEDEVLKYYGE